MPGCLVAFNALVKGFERPLCFDIKQTNNTGMPVPRRGYKALVFLGERDTRFRKQKLYNAKTSAASSFQENLAKYLG
ncbi:hypothetical protein GN244_ATG10511 [Phytophthora infestans]|uniref:Uncharacterized protein n=1 Tax=Phytophthora infestans TaxID=4787 RepID=A0A833S0V7_PHYIN|nr:hypothetical protein GN244_ATG10511 [Phytophthora infestans]KAF4142465.1 hypothetical protein GN958_ATG08339 [Phytophthora infestans]